MKKIPAIFLFGWIVISCSAVWGYTAQDYYNAGNSSFQHGKLDAAVQYYQAAIQMNSQDWQAYQGLGNAQYKLGKTDEALKAFDESLFLNGDNPALKQFVDNYRAAHPADASAPSSGLPDLPAAPVAAPVAQNPSSAPLGMAPKGLPKPGQMEWAVGFGVDLMNFQQYQDYYTEFSTQRSVLPAYGGSLGADLTLTPNFQIGLRVEGILKSPEKVNVTTPSYDEVDVWTEQAVGGALAAKYLIPIMPHYNLILCAEGGYYTLVGSDVASVVTSSTTEGTVLAKMDGSNFGGKIGIEVEWYRETNYGWALDFGVSYRFLTMTPLHAVVTVNGEPYSSGTFENYNGTEKAYVDFSGVCFNLDFRFF